MIKKSMRVDGMTCAMCAKTIENTFASYDNISAKVNVGAGKVLFTYDDKEYSLVQIADMVKEVGYSPVLEETLEDNKLLRLKMRKEIYISVFFSIPLLWAMFSHLNGFDFLYVPELFKNGVFQLVIAGIVQIYIGRRFYIGAYHGIRKNSLGIQKMFG